MMLAVTLLHTFIDPSPSPSRRFESSRSTMPQIRSSSSAGSQREPVIVLVNQISQHGHLDMYARLYSACLLELGYRVVLIAQTENRIVEWLRSRSPSHHERFVFLA